MKNTLPKSFNLLGHTIKVKTSRTLYKSGDRGEFDPKKNIIRVQTNTKDYPVTEDILEQTYYHEMVHCILETLGYHELSNDEKFVDQFGSALHQIIKTENYNKV